MFFSNCLYALASSLATFAPRSTSLLAFASACCFAVVVRICCCSKRSFSCCTLINCWSAIARAFINSCFSFSTEIKSLEVFSAFFVASVNWFIPCVEPKLAFLINGSVTFAMSRNDNSNFSNFAIAWSALFRNPIKMSSCSNRSELLIFFAMLYLFARSNSFCKLKYSRVVIFLESIQ